MARFLRRNEHIQTGSYLPRFNYMSLPLVGEEFRTPTTLLIVRWKEEIGTSLKPSVCLNAWFLWYPAIQELAFAVTSFNPGGGGLICRQIWRRGLPQREEVIVLIDGGLRHGFRFLPISNSPNRDWGDWADIRQLGRNRVSHDKYESEDDSGRCQIASQSHRVGKRKVCGLLTPHPLWLFFVDCPPWTLCWYTDYRGSDETVPSFWFVPAYWNSMLSELENIYRGFKDVAMILNGNEQPRSFTVTRCYLSLRLY